MLEGLFIVFFVAIIVFRIWVTCARQQQRREQEAAAGAANQELTTTRQTMSSRRRQASQQRQQQQEEEETPEPSAPLAEDTPEERVERIKKNLFCRVIERAESVRSLENILKAAEERYDVNNQDDNIITRSYRAAASSVRTLGERECIICLDTYEPGDTICWAKNNQCNHILHEECAIEWLKNHDECPICRADIVNFMGD